MPIVDLSWINALCWLWIAIALAWLIRKWQILQNASQGEIDAFFVFGGGLHRELYVARLKKQYPDVPVLISKGSLQPYILSIFERLQAPIYNVWIEECANSTFDNCCFGLPILKSWQVKKVMLVTSASHLPRAKLLAQIILGAHGIWVESSSVTEICTPGNQESKLKTVLDAIRASAWAIVSQFYSCSCSNIIPLAEVKMNEWQDIGIDVNCCQRYKFNLAGFAGDRETATPIKSARSF